MYMHVHVHVKQRLHVDTLIHICFQTMYLTCIYFPSLIYNAIDISRLKKIYKSRQNVPLRTKTHCIIGRRPIFNRYITHSRGKHSAHTASCLGEIGIGVATGENTYYSDARRRAQMGDCH